MEKTQIEKNFELRVAKRDCYCRFCDKEILRQTEKMINTYSDREKGQNIYICLDCVEEMAKSIMLDEG